MWDGLSIRLVEHLVQSNAFFGLLAAKRPATLFFALQVVVSYLVHLPVLRAFRVSEAARAGTFGPVWSALEAVVQAMVSATGWVLGSNGYTFPLWADGAGWLGPVAVLVEPPMLAFGLFACVVELVLKHSDTFDDLIRELRLDHVAGATSTLLASLLLALLGAPVPAEQALGGLSSEQAAAVSAAASGGSAGGAAGPPLGWLLVSVVVSLAVNQAAVWARGQVVSVLGDLHLARWWRWIETGGILGALAIAVAAPFLMTALAIALALALGLAWSTFRAWDLWADRRARRPCPAGCGAAVRVEACRCPRCRAAVPRLTWLGGAPVPVASPVVAPPAGALEGL
jgi:hypothetical protein